MLMLVHKILKSLLTSSMQLLDTKCIKMHVTTTNTTTITYRHNINYYYYSYHNYNNDIIKKPAEYSLLKSGNKENSHYVSD